MSLETMIYDSFLDLLERPESALRLEELALKQSRLRASRRQLYSYRPYPKQAEFHAAGAQFRERLLKAANRVGKTWCAGMEVAMHLTGEYPDGSEAWGGYQWIGRRFDRPTRWIVGSESAELTRKGIQRILLGTPEAREQWGTGSIPKELLIDTTARSGVPNAVATIAVRHRPSGQVSTVQLGSYDQGRTKWQADAADGVWFDEEPPLEVYSEGLTRTMDTGGLVLMTFTPLMGVTQVVTRFLYERPPGSHVTDMTLWDAGHFTPELIEAAIAGTPEFERDARTKGIPQLGSGRVFTPIQADEIRVKPFQIPDYWRRIGGLDFGWEHPSAAVQLAHDPDTDTLYVIAARRARRETPATFSSTIVHWGPIPWAWPHDGLQHDKGSGQQLAAQYKACGLKMLPGHATFTDGSNGVEAGVQEMWDRMVSGRLKVFESLTEWFEEFALYHRQEGIIIKLNDDLISATRYAMMMRRFAEPLAQRARQSFGAPVQRRDGLGWMAG